MTTQNHMSRTLAIEIAERVFAVVNPANREMRLRALLEDRGFRLEPSHVENLADKSTLIVWLRSTYGTR